MLIFDTLIVIMLSVTFFLSVIMMPVVMLSVVMLSVIMMPVVVLSVLMLTVIMIPVVKLSVVMLSVIMMPVDYAVCRNAERHGARIMPVHLLPYFMCTTWTDLIKLLLAK